eukprot:m.15071 g.15071  ORF g.15071 m.15071 type:complete len:415 (+) comp7805_c0_seq3:55-1299(+)
MSRRGGAFQSTMNPVDLSIRGHSSHGRRQQQQQRTDLNLSNSFNRMDHDAFHVRREAQTLKHRSEKHMNGCSQPILRKQIRKETNKSIQDFERDTKALVLSLREVERSTSQDVHKFKRMHKQFETFIEEVVKRTVWMNKESVKRRAGANHVPDSVDLDLEEERRMAKMFLDTSKRIYRDNEDALKDMSSCMKFISRELKKEKRPLGLNSEAYAGMVAKYPKPQGSAPPVVTRAREESESARRMCADTKEFMAMCSRDLQHQRDAVDNSLRQLIKQFKHAHADLLQAQGDTRRALHQTHRAAWSQELTEEINEGPREGKRYQKIADRTTRPTVRSYDRRVREDDVDVVAWEDSSRAKRQLQRQKDLLQQDVSMLSTTSRTLSNAVRDRKHLTDCDNAVLKFRNRCGPGKRVLTRS